MKNLITILLLTVVSLTSNAQLDGYMKSDETLLNFSLNVVTLKNPVVQYEDGQKFGPYLAPGFGLSHYNFDQWGYRWGMEFKWVTDIFPEIYSLFEATYINRPQEPMLSGFWWTDMGTNVYVTEYFNVGVGGHFADYLVEIPDIDSANLTTIPNQPVPTAFQEPTGWYWAVGPTIYLDAGYKQFFLSIKANYSFSYWRPRIREKEYEDAINKIDGYPAPRFLYIDVTVNHDSGFFISFNRTMTIDRGIRDYKFSRNDLGIGWKF